jgi:hypothetical protein
MKLRTMVSSVLAAALVTAFMVGMSASPAAAATGCGSVCDDQDPLTFRIHTGPYDWYTCADDAQTIYTAYEVSGGYVRSAVQLRYSPRCRTAWAYTDYEERYIWVERSYPHRVEDAYPTGRDAPYRTRMVNDAGYVSRACLSIPYGGQVCTGWY